MDTGADITLIGPEAFKRIAPVAKLHRRNFKPSDKTPKTYDQKTFHIDGWIDVDISFQERVIKTPVYVKMDPKEQLLQSEGVCRQLGVVTCHNSVVPGQQQIEAKGSGREVYVPTVRVMQMKTVKLKPDDSAVKFVGGDDGVRVEGGACGTGSGTNGDVHQADSVHPRWNKRKQMADRPGPTGEGGGFRGEFGQGTGRGRDRKKHRFYAGIL